MTLQTWIFPISLCAHGTLEVINPIRIENCFLLKKRAIDRPLCIVNLARLFLFLFEITIIHE